MVLLAAIGGYGASKSQVDNSLQVWQSADSPDWLAYQQFLKRTRLADPLIIFIPQQVEGLTLVQIRKVLKALPNVSSCKSVGLETINGTRDSLLTLMPIAEESPLQLTEILK